MKSSVVRLSVAVVAASLMLVALPAPLATAAGPFQYHSLSPCRAVDTRVGQGPILSDSGPIGSAPRTFTIHGVCGVPATADAVSINVTAVGPTGQGFLTLFPSGTSQPTVSNINYNAGEPALGNGAIVPLGAGATLDLSVFTRVVGPGTVHMVIDVTGYFDN
jgi:hypothetical protein